MSALFPEFAQHAALAAVVALTLACAGVASSSPDQDMLLPGFHSMPLFDEQSRELRTPEGIRVVIQAPRELRPERPTLLLVFATPNGNTIEQTLGQAMTPGKNWHFDIQHISAQTRVLRRLTPERNVVLACTEAEGLSWPAWRSRHPDASDLIHELIDSLRAQVPGKRIDVALAAHSGGGSFIFGFINSAPAIPDWISDIAFLDANYSYSVADGHADKLLNWLKKSARRRLVVIAYDDRNIELNGKKVVSETGGTFRASGRMLASFEKNASLKLKTVRQGPFVHTGGADGRLQMYVHTNPENKILHTVLVGEMNGLLQAMTVGTRTERMWGSFGGPRAYTAYITPGAPEPPCLPERNPTASGGASLMMSIAGQPQADREGRIFQEILSGNVPPFCREFQSVCYEGNDAKGRAHSVELQVMTDYLSVGGPDDYVRVCLTPMTAQQIADCLGCSLPTCLLSDIIWQNAPRKIEPHPLTEDREASATFVQHSHILDGQLQGTDARLLTSGEKKDIVLSNALKLKPHKVAIYGWHHLNGVPIQPLTNVHRDTYVDYSHGTRLIQRRMLLDGEVADLADIMTDPVLCPLVSNEGPILPPRYTQPPIVEAP